MFLLQPFVYVVCRIRWISWNKRCACNIRKCNRSWRRTWGRLWMCWRNHDRSFARKTPDRSCSSMSGAKRPRRYSALSRSCLTRQRISTSWRWGISLFFHSPHLLFFFICLSCLHCAVNLPRRRQRPHAHIQSHKRTVWMWPYLWEILQCSVFVERSELPDFSMLIDNEAIRKQLTDYFPLMFLSVSFYFQNTKPVKILLDR